MFNNLKRKIQFYFHSYNIFPAIVTQSFFFDIGFWKFNFFSSLKKLNYIILESKKVYFNAISLPRKNFQKLLCMHIPVWSSKYARRNSSFDSVILLFIRKSDICRKLKITKKNIRNKILLFWWVFSNRSKTNPCLAISGNPQKSEPDISIKIGMTPFFEKNLKNMKNLKKFWKEFEKYEKSEKVL